MEETPPLTYLQGYPDAVRQSVSSALASGQLATRLQERYQNPPKVTTDRLLLEYVTELKQRFLRRAPPLSKVLFDDKMGLKGLLGTQTYVSRVQGARLQAKHELRIASLFKRTPPEFLHMVAVHELAHLKEKEHSKAFYRLCCHMEPNYVQYEFDLRLYLTVHGL